MRVLDSSVPTSGLPRMKELVHDDVCGDILAGGGLRGGLGGLGEG